MISRLFCPNHHLILDQPLCPQCGWRRPPAGEVGKPLWGPLDLGFQIGGPGRDVFAHPVASAGILVLPTRIGVLLGVRLIDGEILWQTALPAGRMTRHLLPQGERLWFSLSDERSIGKAGPSQLAELDPQTGAWQPLWEHPAHYLTPPLFTPEGLVLRTSGEEILCLQATGSPSPTFEVRWRQRTVAWWAVPMATDGNSLLYADGYLMQGQHWLTALRLSDGKPLRRWELGEMYPQPPLFVAGLALVLDGAKKLLALDLQSEQPLWQKRFPRLYSNLVSDGERIYFSRRGETPSGHPEHYLLTALDPQTGEEIWRLSLPAHCRRLTYAQGILYLCADDGILRAVSTAGKMLWEYPIGSDEDPIQTAPLVAEGVLVAATYHGRLLALTVQGESRLDAQTLWQRGEVLAAAEQFALQGDLQRAAEIFQHSLQQPALAAQLYAAGGNWLAAAQAFEAGGDSAAALKAYEKAGAPLEQARLLAEFGRFSDAAKLYEQNGDLRTALTYYEKSGIYDQAYRCALKLKDTETLQRLRSVVPPTKEEIEEAISKRQYDEAARLALLNPQTYLLAADLYQKIGQKDKELQALKALAEVQRPPPSDLLQRLASVARQCGEFLLEAQTWERLEEYEKSAQAYQRAALQLISTAPDAEMEIAALYEKAKANYQSCGLDEQAAEMARQVAYYRHLPVVVVQLQSSEGFRELEFNTLKLIVHNLGFSIAHQVTIQVLSDRFEVDCQPCDLEIDRVAPQRARSIEISVRPLSGQVGKVPLRLRWSWQDRFGQHFESDGYHNVPVKGRSETPSTGVPLNIYYQAPVYTTGGGQLNVVSGGDLVQPGAQKGDRIEIRRGEGGGISLTSAEFSAITAAQAEDKETRIPCPNCQIPIPPNDAYCTYCGHPIKARRPSRRKGGLSG